MSMRELLTVMDAARVLDLAPATVRQLENTGKLPAMRTVSGTRLFRRADVEDLKRRRAAGLSKGSVSA
jgi:excisionase family DNA binding protein